MAGAFSGLLAFAIQNMDGVASESRRNLLKSNHADKFYLQILLAGVGSLFSRESSQLQ